MSRLTIPLVAVALLPLAACGINPGKGSPVTPQRPTLSSDTNTTAVGSIEMEVGTSFDPGDSTAIPLVLKYGLSEGKEIFVGASVLQHVEFMGSTEVGFGDMILGGRMRFHEGEKFSAAGLLTMKLPTADETSGLGSGETDFLGAGIMTAPLGDTGSITGYYEFGLLGDPTGGVNTQHLFAVSPSVAIAEDLSLFGELAIYKIQGSSDPSLLMLGMAKTLAPDMIADAGVVFGVNDAAPDFSLFVGMTINLGPAMTQSEDAMADPIAEGSSRRSASLANF